MPRADTPTTHLLDEFAEPRADRKAGGAAPLCLVGTGSFALELAEWAEDAGWEVTCLIELLDPGRVGSIAVGGREVVAPDHARAESDRAVVAMGGARREHWSRLRRGRWRGGTVVHPRAHVSRSVRLSEGCIVGPHATIGAEAIVGEHTLISRGALLGHHARVGAFVSLLPGANIGGGAVLGDDVTVGMGASVLNGVIVGSGAIVAAGALVRSEVRAGSRVQGVPAQEYPR